MPCTGKGKIPFGRGRYWQPKIIKITKGRWGPLLAGTGTAAGRGRTESGRRAGSHRERFHAKTHAENPTDRRSSVRSKGLGPPSLPSTTPKHWSCVCICKKRLHGGAAGAKTRGCSLTHGQCGSPRPFPGAPATLIPTPTGQVPAQRPRTRTSHIEFRRERQRGAHTPSRGFLQEGGAMTH